MVNYTKREIYYFFVQFLIAYNIASSACYGSLASALLENNTNSKVPAIVHSARPQRLKLIQAPGAEEMFITTTKGIYTPIFGCSLVGGSFEIAGWHHS